MEQQSNQLEDRKKYILAFNDTMIKIWKERITLLGVLHSGALYNSVMEIATKTDSLFIDMTLSQKFNEYGLYQDAGTGRETPVGNPGDIGRDKNRKARRWFSVKYFASYHNLREFLAENLGKDLALTVSNALTSQIRARFKS